MTNLTAKRVSLFRETIAVVKATVSEWWPWVLVFGLFFAALQIGLAQISAQGPLAEFMQQHPEMRDNEDYFKAHPEIMKQYNDLVIVSMPRLIGGFSIYLILAVALYGSAIYMFAVIMMNKLWPSLRLNYSVGAFVYWFKKMVWKYLRPILWCLLPIIGMFFYMRSLVKYVAVSPLALLQKGDELKTSWQLTNNNWWRIFGNQCLLSLAIFLVAFVFGLVITLVALVITMGHKTPAFNDVVAFAQGMSMAFGSALAAAFACVVYKVLSEEAGENNAADSGKIVH